MTSKQPSGGASTQRLTEPELIEERRRCAFHQDDSDPAQTKKPADPQNVVGLALSGGGIRSALYNDGFLQGLSHRGFLRYVDYLASVSGGGYIAGHLISQGSASESHDETKCFHDSPRSESSASKDQENFERWHLGRDPQTGQIDPDRLAGVGGYLSRPMQLLPAYLWACVFSLAFYFGTCAIVATLVAIFWRSFDDPMFRLLYMDTFGIRTGDELMIAFIPFILLLIFYVVCEVVFTAIRLYSGFNNRKRQLWHAKFRATLLVGLLLAFLTSIAIFLGNSTTKVNATSSASIHLNQYAQYLAVIAGALQVLVFFGSDQLLRSERQEAKSWQKALQKLVSASVLMLLLFALVHWMGRENISRFVDQRNPSFVIGDIDKWYALKSVLSDPKDREYSKALQAIDKQWEMFNGKPDLVDHLPAYLKPVDPWEETLAASRWRVWTKLKVEPSGYFSKQQYKSEKLEGVWFIEHRVFAAAIGYWLTIRDHNHETLMKELQPKLKDDPGFFLIMSQSDTYPPSVADTYEIVRRCYVLNLVLQQYQQALLNKWNERLKSPHLTAELIARVVASSDVPSSAGNPSQLVSNTIMNMLEEKASDLSSDQRQQLTMAARIMRAMEAEESKSAKDRGVAGTQTLKVNGKELTSTVKTQLARDRAYTKANRLLLEVLYPSVIRRIDLPSTYVINPYDQRARQSWLGFFFIVALVGTSASLFRYQYSAVFRFYRNQIGMNFLIPGSNGKSMLNEALFKLRPTSKGLPYPLMLAASLEPVTIEGSYQVRTRPFLLSPINCGDDDSNEAHNQSSSEQFSLKQRSSDPPITLGDAVTLSGAAVSPLMTNNRVLALLVDIFNTGLGAQVYRASRGTVASRSVTLIRDRLSWSIAVVLAILFVYVILVTTSDWLQVIAATVLVCLVFYSLVTEKGSPHFLRTLFFPREIGKRSQSHTEEPISHKSFYVADGGFCDYLGVSSLLRRRCELIMVSDAGANVGTDHLGTLAKMCQTAQAELGVNFLDLDHEAPIDFGRLQVDERRLVHQPYLIMRVRYPDGSQGLLVYCQMAITETDPIEIKQIRNKFPKFPDEPTVNQFYSDDQVAAYRALGYHVASKVCGELERWNFFRRDVATANDSGTSTQAGNPSVKTPTSSSGIESFRQALASDSFRHNPSQPSGVPYFEVIRERLLTAYRLACYEEISYRRDDIYCEAIWPVTDFAFPNFHLHAERVFSERETSLKTWHELDDNPWLQVYEKSGDVRSAYRTAVSRDINAMGIEDDSYSYIIFDCLRKLHPTGQPCNEYLKTLFASHLVNLAVACQELHRGKPHATFQIGGRLKLIDLCRRISEQLVSDDVDDQFVQEKLDRIAAELTELERSIFQGSEHVTVVSFVQCLALSWGRFVRETAEARGINNKRLIIAQASTVFQSKGTPVRAESCMVETRRELDRGMRLMQTQRVLKALARTWYLGFLGRQAKKAFIGRPDLTFNFSTVADELQLSGTETANLAKAWVNLFRSNSELASIYHNAVTQSRDVTEFDEVCYLEDLYREVVKKLAASKNVAGRAMHWHMSATALATFSLSLKKPMKDVSLGRLRSIVNWTDQWKKLRTTSGRVTDDQDLESKLQQLTTELIAGPFKAGLSGDWSPEASAVFGKCLICFWAKTLKTNSDGEAKINSDRMEKFFAATASGAKSSEAEPGSQAATSHSVAMPTIEDLVPLMTPTRQSELQLALGRIWYINYLTEEEFNHFQQRQGRHSPESRQPRSPMPQPLPKQITPSRSRRTPPKK